MNKSSSVIKSSTPIGNDLRIEFVGGKTYDYAGAASHARPLAEAASQGRYFLANVKDAFPASLRS